MVIRVTKRTQHCTFCKNHGSNTPKKGHHCPYLNCPCLLCKLTKKAQVAMRHQQRVWRHQKQKLKNKKFDAEELASAGIESKPSKSQACDKCRNHNILMLKRNHRCPFLNCKCEYCSLTFKRREIMKHQQRVRRSKITTQVDSDGASELSGGEKPEQEEGKEYVYFRNEETCNYTSGTYYDEKERCEDDSTGFRSSENDQIINGRNEKEFPALPMESLSLRPDMGDTEDSSGLQSYSHPSENNTFLNGLEDQSTELLPPLISLAQNQQQTSYSYQEETRSTSPNCNSLDQTLETTSMNDQTRLQSPYSYPVENRCVSSSNTCPRQSPENVSPPQYENKCEQSNQACSFFLPERDTTFQAFPFSSQQSLQRLSALNASLEPSSMSSMKYGTQMEDFDLRSRRSWIQSSFTGSPLGNISQSTALLLHHQQQQLQASQQPLHPVRPLPLNMIRSRHPSTSGMFAPNFWNPMFLPFNFSLHPHNSSDLSMDHFPRLQNSAPFSGTELFHPT